VAPPAPPHKNKHFGGQAPYFAGLLPFSMVAAPSKRVKKTKIKTSACTDLVVWGQNLPSLVGCGKLSKLSTQHIELPSYQYDNIVGILLSDGWLSFASSHNKNARFGFEQSYKHAKYFCFVFSILSVLKTRDRKGGVNKTLVLYTPFFISSSRRYFSTSSVAYSPIIPVKDYSNADLDKVQILAENKGKSGIYLWTNNTNGLKYGGSSVNLRRGLREYFNINHLELNKSMPICRALLQYGYSNFSFSILEYCAPYKCIARENHYISSLNPDYNLCAVAGSWLGKKHSAVTREKLSAANLGKILSATTRARMSAAQKGKIHSEEHKENILTSMPNRKKVEALNLETNITTTYSSIRQAARALNISHTAILKNLNSKFRKPYKGRYIFKYI
jgi:group I intron endonuclease